MISHKYKITEEEFNEFKKKRNARLAVTRAILSRNLVRSNCCEMCENNTKTNAHHVDYGNPLKVIWLCNKCHGKAHTKHHPLNPRNNKQTPCPYVFDSNDSVVVSFSLPVKHFIALKEDAKSKNKPFSHVVRQHIKKAYPIESNQLEFNFEENKNDHSQDAQHKNIQSMGKNEIVLPKQKSSILPSIRRKGDFNMSRVDSKLFELPDGYERDSRTMQQSVACG